MKNNTNNFNSIISRLMIVAIMLQLGCSESPPKVDPLITEVIEREKPVMELNLRIHIMKDIVVPHPSGITLESWVSLEAVRDTIVPEMNAIWEQAKIKWVIESIIEEDVVKDISYAQSVSYIANCGRDEEGRSDPARLPLLFSMMQPEYRSQADEIDRNLFHLYIFPFIGNTSQGNAMRGFDWHSIVGSWSNKHNGGGVPEKTLLTENQKDFDRGSLSRTASHELGHVLGLSHDECPYDCLMSGGSNGYSLTDAQIAEARLEASLRLF